MGETAWSATQIVLVRNDIHWLTADKSLRKDISVEVTPDSDSKSWNHGVKGPHQQADTNNSTRGVNLGMVKDKVMWLPLSGIPGKNLTHLLWKEWDSKYFRLPGHVVTIVTLASATVAQHSIHGNLYTSGHGWVPVKLYSTKQAEGQIWSIPLYWLPKSWLYTLYL